MVRLMASPQTVRPVMRSGVVAMSTACGSFKKMAKTTRGNAARMMPTTDMRAAVILATARTEAAWAAVTSAVVGVATAEAAMVATVKVEA